MPRIRADPHEKNDAVVGLAREELGGVARRHHVVVRDVSRVRRGARPPATPDQRRAHDRAQHDAALRDGRGRDGATSSAGGPWGERPSGSRSSSRLSWPAGSFRCQPASGPPVRRPLRHVGAEQTHPTGGRRHQAGDAVEQRGLAGAVRADETGDRRRRDRERNPVECRQAAEADGDVERL